MDYPIFNVLILERFPRFSPLCFGLWTKRWVDEIVSTWAVRPAITHIEAAFMCKPTILQRHNGCGCFSSKDHDRISKMLNIWTKTTVALHTSVTLKKQMFATHAIFSLVTHTHTLTHILMSICPLYRDYGSCFVIRSRHQYWSHIVTSDLSRGITNTWGRHTFVQMSPNNINFHWTEILGHYKH